MATAADRRWGGAGSNQYEGLVIFGSGYKCYFKNLLFFWVGVKTSVAKAYVSNVIVLGNKSVIE